MGRSGVGTGSRQGQPVREVERVLRDRRQRRRERVLGADCVRPEDDRRSEQIQGDRRIRVGLLSQQLLELGLLLRVEQPSGRAGRPLLGHPDRIVGMKAVGGDRRGVHEPLGAGVGGRTECVHRALDVDRADRLAGRGARDHEREMDDDVCSLERLAELVAIANVALAIGHLAPPVLGRVERAPRDSDDASDALVGLEQWDQPEPERPGRPGDRDGQPLVRQGRPRGRTATRSAHRARPARSR